MTLVRIPVRVLTLSILALLPLTAAADPAPPPKLAAVLDKPAPESVEELRVLQQGVREVVRQVTKYTVNVRIGAGQGSGVIISEDGYVLTAGHVSGRADREAVITLPDGRQVKGKTLGANRDVDSGLVKITDPGPWPHAEMGKSAELKKGQWCVTVGHPGGYRPGRPPVVRLGRVLETSGTFLRTDCTLVGGDSGGPLFDMTGKVIGIHSRIGGPLTVNLHVPVDTFNKTWDRLAAGEVWGGFFSGVSTGNPYLGFQADPDASEIRVQKIDPGSPAEKAGLRIDDVVTRFDGRRVNTLEDLRNLLGRKKPGEEVALNVARGEQAMVLKVTIGRKS